MQTPLQSRDLSVFSPRDEEDDEDFVDPFADLSDGGAEDLRRLKLMFSWTPPRQVVLH